MKKSPSILFVYGLFLTLMAFLLKNISALALLALLNFTVGLALGGKRFKMLLVAFIISLIGVLTNALVFAGGEPLWSWGFIVVRKGAIRGFIEVSLKLTLLLSATLIFSSLTNPRELLKSLESELGVPKQLSFMVSLSLRLLRIFEKDLAEIQLIRRSRGLRATPITLSDWESLLTPLLSIGLERGRWIGIAAELRGFSLRKVEKKGLKLQLGDVVLITAMLAQAAIAVFLQLNPLIRCP
ncbi:MAG: hypothetical protein DRN04_05760 [Thermoprotei archaeon]|nr:MAG: hypothetical protein DRN04_05760 [Thermoprotei archaeon]